MNKIHALTNYETIDNSALKNKETIKLNLKLNYLQSKTYQITTIKKYT